MPKAHQNTSKTCINIESKNTTNVPLNNEIVISYTLMTRLLATVPMRSGAAIGRTHVANIRIRNSHPDNANQRKKIVYEDTKDNKTQ